MANLDERAALTVIVDDLTQRHTSHGACNPLAGLGIRAVIEAAWQARAVYDQERAGHFVEALKALQELIRDSYSHDIDGVSGEHFEDCVACEADIIVHAALADAEREATT